MVKRIRGASPESAASYVGMLGYGNACKIVKEILATRVEQTENFADIEIETFEVTVPRY